jgi:uncharacterized protein YecE (DUF72 family)
MPAIHAGAQLERPPGPKYLEELRFAEIALPAPLPRANTLARWRGNLPEDFLLSLVAPRPTFVSQRGPLRFDDDLEAAVEWLGEAAEALGARAVVLPTAAEVSTGPRDRDLLAAYVERLPRGAERLIVWAPTGLWEPDEAADQAGKLGLVYAFDPLEAPVPPGPVAYGRLRAIGGRQRLTEGMLEQVHDALASSAATEAMVAIESPRSFNEAVALQRLTHP